MIEILAALSVSAAAGMRIALPLLVILLIGILQSGDFWYSLPLLSLIHPSVLVGVLTSWSLFELFGSKKLLGQRVLQIVQLLLSPVVGGIMGVAIARFADAPTELVWIIGTVASLFAFVLQLVLVGWFFRLRGLPLWFVLIQDVLCIALVIFAFDAPQQGGLIALLLLWLAIRSSQRWHDWYRGQRRERRLHR